MPPDLSDARSRAPLDCSYLAESGIARGGAPCAARRPWIVHHWEVEGEREVEIESEGGLEFERGRRIWFGTAPSSCGALERAGELGSVEGKSAGGWPRHAHMPTSAGHAARGSSSHQPGDACRWTPPGPCRGAGMLRIYGDTVHLLSTLRPVIEAISRQDRDLVGQLRRAATSVLLKMAESSRPRGEHRRERHRRAQAGQWRDLDRAWRRSFGARGRSWATAVAGLLQGPADAALAPKSEPGDAGDLSDSPLRSALEVRARHRRRRGPGYVAAPDAALRDRPDKVVRTPVRLPR